ncbi:hypothetical protein DSO57_1019671 [Entomophthora muscae]|uniref:Uncharacterized protein n=1 Tax=Entomophthora muscae TaxID=34485 RepID=A0ACC2RIQ4_9FUNG|nr:hypothetical protein DSO57_1019671 [Entomophthora muscae]
MPTSPTTDCASVDSRTPSLRSIAIHQTSISSLLNPFKGERVQANIDSTIAVGIFINSFERLAISPSLSYIHSICPREGELTDTMTTFRDSTVPATPTSSSGRSEPMSSPTSMSRILPPQSIEKHPVIPIKVTRSKPSYSSILITPYANHFWQSYTPQVRENLAALEELYSAYLKRDKSKNESLPKPAISSVKLTEEVLVPWLEFIEGMETFMSPIKRRTLFFACLSQDPFSTPSIHMEFRLLQPSEARKLSKIAFKLFNLYCRGKLSDSKHQKCEVAFLCTFKLHRYQLHAWFNAIRSITSVEPEAHSHTLTKVLVSQVYSAGLDLEKHGILDLADCSL